jgi:uncharacterized membrane protein YbhN (UPF0104 family)
MERAAAQGSETHAPGDDATACLPGYGGKPGSVRATAAWRNWFFALMLVAALVVSVLHRHEIARLVLLAGKARPGWLVLAVVLQLSTYLSLALGWQAVLRHAGHPQPMPRLIRIAFTKLFADQALPSAGLGGNVVLVDQLMMTGVPRGAAVAALILSMIGFYAAYGLCRGDAGDAVAAGPCRALDRRAGQPVPAGGHGHSRRGAVAAAARAGPHAALDGAAELCARPARSGGRGAGRAAAQPRADRSGHGLERADLSGGCGHAAGLPARAGAGGGFGAAYIAFMMASIVITLGPVPLGLGSFEATCTAMLRLLGVPFEGGFAATMLLRVLTLWLPLLPGLVLMRGAIRPNRENADLSEG